MNETIEHLLLHKCKPRQISYIKSNPEQLHKLLELSLDYLHPLSKRAASLLWSCIPDEHFCSETEIDLLLDILLKINESHQREVFKILFELHLIEAQQGILYAHCVNGWSQTQLQPSVRYNALKMMLKIANQHKELFSEIDILTQSQYLETFSINAAKAIRKMVENNCKIII
ncbi:MAG: hypothetical protein IPO21_10475 [Bacteroidales bacterium]|nr:hypothetical protein [Bacteroidales bacterium]